MLGAANLGDIGTHFPDNSEEYKDIDSKLLLRKVVKMLEEKNYRIVNIDSTVLLQRPKLKNYIPEMKASLSKVLQQDTNCISIKATTTENLGFIGREEGIAAQAVVLIEEE
ncbi:2-C-methyl-D-erythritol 2,4-cyclodiphosphate synthase [subsurface metagenome]